MAAVIAWLWFGQLPAGMALPGLFVIMLGVTVVVAADARRAGPLAGGPGEARVPVTVPAHPFPTLGAVHVGDPRAHLWSAAREGRFDEVEATIRRLEVRAIQNHGTKSPEATHWIEVRAVVARIAGSHGPASQLWLIAARFHSSSPGRDLRAARAFSIRPSTSGATSRTTASRQRWLRHSGPRTNTTPTTVRTSRTRWTDTCCARTCADRPDVLCRRPAAGPAGEGPALPPSPPAVPLVHGRSHVSERFTRLRQRWPAHYDACLTLTRTVMVPLLSPRHSSLIPSCRVPASSARSVRRCPTTSAG